MGPGPGFVYTQFPVLLEIVNNIQSEPSSEEKPLFTSPLSNCFRKPIIFVSDDEIHSSGNSTTSTSNPHPSEKSAETSNSMDKTTLSAEPLSVSPSRLTTISALRDTVGTLQTEFTQFQIVSSGDIQQLKDKIVKQDNLLKLQKKAIDDIASDLSSQVKSLSDSLLQQSTLLKKVQEENQLLQKQKAKLAEENAILAKKQSELEKDVAFLKEQVGALWQKPADNSKSHPLEPDHPLELDQKCRYTDEPKPKFTDQETRNIYSL